MPIFDADVFDDHRSVTFHSDPDSGLRAIVAIHASRDGRACGGCRMRPYASDQEAVEDVLRLSRAMSCKTALAGVAAGGAKAVIVGPPPGADRTELLRAMGRLIDSFGGAYVSAPDVGIGLEDLRTFRAETGWVVGVDHPSAPFTARGVFAGLRVAAERALGRTGLDGVRVAVQGVGSVGAELCGLLAGEGAELVVADVDAAAVAAMVERHGARAVPVEEILFADVDVLAPCALGGVLDDAAIPRIRARAIAGAANNQLAAPRHGELLRERGVLYAPDYVVSAGGVIAGLEELDGFDAGVVAQRIAAIGDTLHEVFERAEAAGVAPSAAADRLAAERIARWRAGAAA